MSDKKTTEEINAEHPVGETHAELTAEEIAAENERKGKRKTAREKLASIRSSIAKRWKDRENKLKAKKKVEEKK